VKALVVSEHGRIRLENVPEPAQADEYRIRVRMAGICGTDLQLLEGYAEFRGIPGHEFVGIVDRVPNAADQSLIGRRVVGEINVGCGQCESCVKGVKEHCASRKVLGIRERAGAFAEWLWLPRENLHLVPDAIDDASAVFVEPVAAACRILEQIAIDDRTSIAVIGDGRLGLLIGQVLRTSSADVTMFGRHPWKLAIARTVGLAVSDSEHQPSRRFDVVVDATGRPQGLARALELVKPRGTVVVKSTFHGEASLPLWPVVVDEVSLVGSRCGPFTRAIELLRSGAVQVAPLVSSVHTLDDYEAAFGAAGRSMKVLFDLR
jgi:threonine dehydrogenase-like Zn-dependent dehydrogenase